MHLHRFQLAGSSAGALERLLLQLSFKVNLGSLLLFAQRWLQPRSVDPSPHGLLILWPIAYPSCQMMKEALTLRSLQLRHGFWL